MYDVEVYYIMVRVYLLGVLRSVLCCVYMPLCTVLCCCTHKAKRNETNDRMQEERNETKRKENEVEKSTAKWKELNPLTG